MFLVCYAHMHGSLGIMLPVPISLGFAVDTEFVPLRRGEDPSLLSVTASMAHLPASTIGAHVRERARLRRQQRLEKEEYLDHESSEERVRRNILRARARRREEAALLLRSPSAASLLSSTG